MSNKTLAEKWKAAAEECAALRFRIAEMWQGAQDEAVRGWLAMEADEARGSVKEVAEDGNEGDGSSASE